jgi:hypothetical protein
MDLKNMCWGLLEQDTEKNIYTSEGETEKKMEKELHNSYLSPNNIGMTKSRKTRWVNLKACIEENKYLQSFGTNA